MHCYSDECFLQHKDISVLKYTYTKKTREHRHDFFEIAYVEDGEGYHIVNGREYKITKGDYIFIDTTVSHCYDGNVKIVNLIFKPRFLDKMCRNIKSIKELYNIIGVDIRYGIMQHNSLYQAYQDDGSIINKILEIETEINKKQPGFEEYIKLVLRQIIIQTKRNICLDSAVDIEENPVKYIEKYIYEHYDEDISLSKICDELGYSMTYISRLFKQKTSYTFIQYLQSTRMQMACHLFTNYKNLTVYEVAEKVGYTDLKYFNLVFKKYIGVTPYKYRR